MCTEKYIFIKNYVKKIPFVLDVLVIQIENLHSYRDKYEKFCIFVQHNSLSFESDRASVVSVR